MTISNRIISDFSSIDSRDWEQLEHRDNPFLSYAFLSSLEKSGSIGSHTGWQPNHLALISEEQLVAFAPTYIKTNSHGEFVFDWAWADAYHRHGLAYYPKLLTAIPYSPVTGPRLLTQRGHQDAAGLKDRLLEFALAECAQQEYSSWHCNFISDEDRAAFAESSLLSRADWQFHWYNHSYEDFEDFLGQLRSRKRKNIRRERRQLQQAGLTVQWKSGADLLEPDLDFIYACYIDTFRNYGNHPALRKRFFAQLAEQLPEQFLVALAYRDDQPVAMGLFLAGGDRLYGRYWGCSENIPGLHFEVAYYQGIEYCIRNKIKVFESGAQGEHKIGRGFLPTRTGSFHYIREEPFRSAISDFLSRENMWLDEYREQLERHDPYRRDPA